MAPPDTATIRSYLLRTMTEAERGRFEDAYFHDDRLLDLVETEEDRLVADYVLGRLTESDRRRFEGSLLDSPYYKERVETTSRLHRSLARPELFQRPARPGRAPGTPMNPVRRGSRPPLEADRLFPGRSGSVVAFLTLAVLLLAAVLSALRLRSQLLDARRAAAEAPAVAAPSGGGGVVPAAITVVLGVPSGTGPAARRVLRTPGAALLLVILRDAVPASARTWRVRLMDDSGHLAWDGGTVPVPAGDSSRDLALRLPAGVPPAGRLAVTIAVDDGPPVALLALDLADAPAAGIGPARNR